MGKRHLSKDELLAQLKNIKRSQEMAEKAPYMGVNTITIWVLWKKFKFNKKKIVQFDADYNKYRNDPEFDVNALNQRYFDFSGGDYVDFEWLQPEDFKAMGNKFLDGYCRQKNAEITNRLHLEWATYLIILKNILIDYGYTKEQIDEIDHAISEEINKMDDHADEKTRTGFWWYWYDLRDNAGIEVAKVKWGD